MVKIKFSETAPRIKGKTSSDDFSVSITPSIVNTNQISNYVRTDKDAVIVSDMSASFSYTKFTVNVTSNYPTTITFDGGLKHDGGSEYSSTKDGVASSFFVSGKYGKRKYIVNSRFVEILPQTGTRVVNFVTGTLVENIDSTIKSLFTSKTRGAQSQDLFVSATYSANSNECSAVQNPDRVGFGLVDLSPISFTVNGGRAFPVVLITPRHVLFASHTIPTGNIVFRRNDGTFTETTIVSKSGALGVSDIEIGYLSSEITGITPISVFPDDVKQYIPSMYRDRDGEIGYRSDMTYELPTVPCIGISCNDGYTNPIATQHRHIRAYGYTTTNFIHGNFTNGGMYTVPSDPQLATFWSELYGGDSGTPFITCVSINNIITPVLIGTLFGASMGVGVCRELFSFTPQIEQFIQSTNPIYKLRKIDLSSFPKF